MPPESADKIPWPDCPEQNCNKKCGSKNAAPYQFACPRYMLGSDPMQAAAHADSLGDTFVYAVAGHDKDLTSGGLDHLDMANENRSRVNTTCGECYELHFKTDIASHNYTRKPLIVQTFNSAAGGGSNFDIYMAGGGNGYYNGCNKDIDAGGNVNEGAFLYSDYPKNGQPMGGGTRGGKMYEDTGEMPAQNGCDDGQCITSRAKCDTIFKGNNVSDDYTGSAAATSCKYAYDNNFHWNGELKKVRRVVCPEHLMQITGLRFVDNSLPTAGSTEDKGWYYHNATNSPYTTTTMEDCCRPSCAQSPQIGTGIEQNLYWPTNYDTTYNATYSCDKDGIPFTRDNLNVGPAMGQCYLEECHYESN